MNKWKLGFAGIIVGLLSGLLGVGGGIFIVPILVGIFAVQQHKAQAVSQGVVLPTAIISSFFYFQNGLVDTHSFSIAASMALLSMICAAMVPLLVMVMGLEQQMAQGISLLVIIPTSIVAIWRLHKHELIDWSMVIVMAIGSILGAAISSNFVQYIEPKLLTKIFGFCVILVGLKMYVDAGKNEKKNSAAK